MLPTTGRWRWAIAGIAAVVTLFVIGGFTQGWFSRRGPIKPSWTLDRLEEGYQREVTETLGTVIKWPSQTMVSTNKVAAELETRWRDGWLHYRLRVTPVPHLKRGASLTDLILHIYDPDDFTIVTVAAPRSEMTTLVDDERTAVGLRIEGKAALSRDDYRRAHSWTLGWREK